MHSILFRVPNDPVPSALSLGSNRGDRAEFLNQAVRLLSLRVLGHVVCSEYYETCPVGCPPGTGDFLNAAVTGHTSLSPGEVLAQCRTIEEELGRPVAVNRDVDRTIDIDVLLYGTHEYSEPELTIPHPRMRSRLFVLVPLSDIAAEWKVPPEMCTVAGLRDAVLASACDQRLRRSGPGVGK